MARDESVDILASPPLLGTLAAVAALVDLAWTNGAVRALSERLDHAWLLTLVHWGAVPRNLVGIAGAVALAVSLGAFLHAPREGRIVRAIGLAGFGGIFLPIVVVATLAPVETLAAKWVWLVPIAAGTAHFLAILMTLAAVRRDAPVGVRVAVGLLGVAAFLSFAWMALAHVRLFAETVGGSTLLTVIKRGGELAWLPIPLIAASSIVPRLEETRGKIAITVALASGAIAAALLLWARGEVRGDFPHFIYGLVRTETLVDTVPELYVVTLAAAVGIGAGALSAIDPPRVQAGGAMFLIVAAGYAPQSPLRLLALVLGAAMLSRATIAFRRGVVPRRRPERQPVPQPADGPSVSSSSTSPSAVTSTARSSTTGSE